MKLLRLRVVALILVLFIIIMSSCAGERGILPVQVDGIGTDRQGEKIEAVSYTHLRYRRIIG